MDDEHAAIAEIDDGRHYVMLVGLFINQHPDDCRRRGIWWFGEKRGDDSCSGVFASRVPEQQNCEAADNQKRERAERRNLGNLGFALLLIELLLPLGVV